MASRVTIETETPNYSPAAAAREKAAHLAGQSAHADWMAEWTPEVTAARRAEYNAFAREMQAAGAKMGCPESIAFWSARTWDLASLRYHVARYSR